MPRMLSLKAVSERLGGPETTPIKTVQRWIYAGRLRAFKPGRHPLIREDDLEAFLAASTIGGPKPPVKARGRVRP